MRAVLLAVAVCACGTRPGSEGPVFARPDPLGGAAPTPLLVAMTEELDRIFGALGNQPDGPYFIALQGTEKPPPPLPRVVP